MTIKLEEIDNVGHCSPIGIENFKTDNTCIPAKYKKALQKVKKECNITDDNELSIVNNLCVQQSSLADLIKQYYRPKKPTTWNVQPYTWLTNIDIIAVMRQYTDKYNDFYFPPELPTRDFAKIIYNDVCVSQRICKLTAKKLLSFGKTKLGIIFNLDLHTGSGTHWVAIYTDFNEKSNKYGLCYFDSTGTKPPTEIEHFMLKVQKELNKMNPQSCFKCKYNIMSFQNSTTECGMFSMFFIILCLENPNDTYFEILQKMKVDDTMKKYRNILFRPAH